MAAKRPPARLKKGKLYIAWREPVNPLTGLPTGNIPANKRSETSGHFTEAVYIRPNTPVLYLRRYKGSLVRVLCNETIVQLHEAFLKENDQNEE